MAFGLVKRGEMGSLADTLLLHKCERVLEREGYLMSERSSVQNPIVKVAQQIGWQYINPPEALSQRGDETGLYFSGHPDIQAPEAQPGVVDSSRASEILRKLNLLRPSIEGNRDALSWIRGEQSIFVPEENRERNVQLNRLRSS